MVFWKKKFLLCSVSFKYFKYCYLTYIINQDYNQAKIVHIIGDCNKSYTQKTEGADFENF